LFYVPSDEQLPYIEIQSYQGLVYGSYYVMDPAENTIVSSRPPAVITWMALFGMAFGESGILYVTPVFGVASLVTVYFLGKRLFGARAGALAALWLMVSFPQLHFSRTPYAEVVGQFFVLAALYALVTYWQTRRLTYIPLGIAALAVAFAARVDALIALPTILFFFTLLAARQDWRGLGLGVAAAAVASVFTLWTANEPYLGAIAELLLGGPLVLPDRLGLTAVFLGGLLGLAVLLWLLRRSPEFRLPRSGRWALSLAVLLAAGYALHIRPLPPQSTQAPCSSGLRHLGSSFFCGNATSPMNRFSSCCSLRLSQEPSSGSTQPLRCTRSLCVGCCQRCCPH